jgi:hypothetical protein
LQNCHAILLFSRLIKDLSSVMVLRFYKLWRGYKNSREKKN